MEERWVQDDLARLTRIMAKNELIVYGAFKGMGDLLSAAPVIKQELEHGNQVYLLMFPALEAFVRLLDFGPHSNNLKILHLPVSGVRSLRHFLEQAREISPDVVWISPHAPLPSSSWKIPVLLSVMKKIYWRNAILAGSESERMSRLFDVRSTASRTLPFAEREWRTYSVLGRLSDWDCRPNIQFRRSIQDERLRDADYDLLIHPGANAANRKWPVTKYPALIECLPRAYRIGVIALPEDLAEMRKVLPHDRNIQFVSGTLELSIRTIARARALLSMDSGNAFFAGILDVPGVAIFGASDPANIIGFETSVIPIYQKVIECQPCGRKTCIHAESKCITSLSPAYIAAELVRIIESSPRKLAPEGPSAIDVSRIPLGDDEPSELEGDQVLEPPGGETWSTRP